MSSKIISADELRSRIVPYMNTPLIRLRDLDYFVPSYGWVREFGLWLSTNPKQFQDEKFDCDDFAIEAVTKATRSLLANSEIPKDVSHSFGYCEVLLEKGMMGVSGPGWHALNIVVVDDGRTLLVEPQTGQCDELSNLRSSGGFSRLDFVWV